MSETTNGDRRATYAEISRRRVELRAAAFRRGMDHPRLRPDGTVTVHPPDRGYRSLTLFASDAAALVGSYVRVNPDDVPAAACEASDL